MLRRTAGVLAGVLVVGLGTAAGAPTIGAAASARATSVASAASGLTGGMAGPPGEARAHVLAGAYLASVSCTSRRTCTAVGQVAGQPLAERWNGKRWTVQATPIPHRGAPAYLHAVRCTSATRCTAVGGTGVTASGQRTVPLAERWNGRRWRILATPVPAHAAQAGLYGVDCTSASACMAVGGRVSPTKAATGYVLTERWNGRKWRLVPGVNPDQLYQSLQDVACTAAAACTAVGSTGEFGVGRELVERWNGRRWTAQEPVGGNANPSLNGVACASRTDCIAVGSTGGDLDLTLAEHWNGTTWTWVNTQNPEHTDSAGLAGVSCVSTVSCVAVGALNPYIAGKGNETLAEGWNGKTWTWLPTQNAPASATDYSLADVSCTSARACIAVGTSEKDRILSTEHTLIERWDGTTWVVLPSP